MIKRIYDELLEDHFSQNKQMAFLSGPRQVGKTTTSQSAKNPCIYLNWDNQADRNDIIRGPDNIALNKNFNDLANVGKRIIFDEIHKYSKWKIFLKGYYDTYGEQYPAVVTGSARLNVFKKGGDSLMGRYFLYRMHPLSVAELISSSLIDTEIRTPKSIDLTTMQQLMKYGGFPEPFLKSDTRFYNRWKRMRRELLFKEDMRDLTNIQELSQIEMMAEVLEHQAGQLLNFSSLSRHINVSVDTIRRWLSTLDYLYYCFIIRPWSKNVPKSLRKQPKVYLWDWSMVSDPGSRFENFIASHLMKAVHLWTDAGFADYELYFIRDKMKREVDFLVTRDEKPWFLVEAKSSWSKSISPGLTYYHQLLQTEHALQVKAESAYVDQDCFRIGKPVIVPASTFLSQLV